MHQENGIQKEFNESDWKLFRKRIGQWQENYMEKLNHEYIAILNQDKKASEKFWELHKRIQKDKRKAGVIINLKRSSMVMDIVELLNDGVIEMDNLFEFSDTLKETIQLYRSRFDRLV